MWCLNKLLQHADRISFGSLTAQWRNDKQTQHDASSSDTQEQLFSILTKKIREEFSKRFSTVVKTNLEFWGYNLAESVQRFFFMAMHLVREKRWLVNVWESESKEEKERSLPDCQQGIILPTVKSKFHFCFAFTRFGRSLWPLTPPSNAIKIYKLFPGIKGLKDGLFHASLKLGKSVCVCACSCVHV